MELFVAWVLLSIGVGVLAGTRGQSGFAFFFLSFFMSPIIGLIIVLIMRNRTEDEKKERAQKEDDDKKHELRKKDHELQVESIKAITARTTQVEHATASNPANDQPRSIADEIAKLAELRDKGFLTDSEFQAQKTSLLS